MSVTLRIATSADVPLIESFEDDDDVAASGGDDDTFDWAGEIARVVPWRDIWIAEEAGRPFGVIVAIDPAEEDTHYWGDCAPNLRAIDVWIGAPSDRGRGLGGQAMRLAHERCFACPEVEAVLIDPLIANTRAIGFYRRLGYVDVGPRRFGSDDCLVMRLERARWAQG